MCPELTVPDLKGEHPSPEVTPSLSPTNQEMTSADRWKNLEAELMIIHPHIHSTKELQELQGGNPPLTHKYTQKAETGVLL